MLHQKTQEIKVTRNAAINLPQKQSVASIGHHATNKNVDKHFAIADTSNKVALNLVNMMKKNKMTSGNKSSGGTNASQSPPKKGNRLLAALGKSLKSSVQSSILDDGNSAATR